MRRSATRRRTGRVHRGPIGWRPLALLGVLLAAGVWWIARPPAPEALGQRNEPVLLGVTNPHTSIDFTLVLRLAGQVHLTRFLNELTDPAAPNYHHFIDAAEIGRAHV